MTAAKSIMFFISRGVFDQCIVVVRGIDHQIHLYMCYCIQVMKERQPIPGSREDRLLNPQTLSSVDFLDDGFNANSIPSALISHYLYVLPPPSSIAAWRITRIGSSSSSSSSTTISFGSFPFFIVRQKVGSASAKGSSVGRGGIQNRPLPRWIGCQFCYESGLGPSR